MQKYIDEINKLRTLSGNAQLKYLEEIKSYVIKQILEYTYDPNRMYKIDKGKLSKTIIRKGLLPRKKKETFSFDDWGKFTQLLDYLADKRAANDVDVYKVKQFITDFTDIRVQNFLGMVLYKDLRLNLGVKKIQTVWPEFCNAPQVQLAENYDGRTFTNGLYSRKFDGERMYVCDGIAAYSRTNKLRKPAPIKHIMDELSQIGVGNTFDGEILYFNPDGTEDFKKVVSLISSDDWTPECENLYYVIFDAIETQIFRNKQKTIDFQTTYNLLLNMLEAKEDCDFGYSLLRTKYPHIFIARQDKEKDKLEFLANLYGWEGIMYRNADAGYQYKRTSNLLKMKQMQDGEFEISGAYEGTGRNKGKLGGLYIRYKGNTVGVGSGFTDADREIIWNCRRLIINKEFTSRFSLKVQYFQESQDKKGNYSLRHPVYLCFRRKKDGEEFNADNAIEWANRNYIGMEE